MSSLAQRLQHDWYTLRKPHWLLRGLAWCYQKLLRLRAARGSRNAALPVPLVVVGNITVGGTGKTPLVIALAHALELQGLRVGIISRGYGARRAAGVREVHAGDDPRLCGDEPVMMAGMLDCPVWIGRDRMQAARALLAQHPVDVLLSDDGLQHRGLQADFSICVIDGLRGLGNGHCLPAGPLREPAAALARFDYLLLNGEMIALPVPVHGRMQLQPTQWCGVADSHALPLTHLAPGSVVHAVAGIGNPARFFATLRELGLTVIEHPFADHQRFAASQLDFGSDARVVMSEKDAVKCCRFAHPEWLALRVAAQLPDTLVPALRRRIDSHPSRNCS